MTKLIEGFFKPGMVIREQFETIPTAQAKTWLENKASDLRDASTQSWLWASIGFPVASLLFFPKAIREQI